MWKSSENNFENGIKIGHYLIKFKFILIRKINFRNKKLIKKIKKKLKKNTRKFTFYFQHPEK